MEHSEMLKRLEQGHMLVERLEKLSPDSRWARRASGARGNLVKLLEELQDMLDLQLAGAAEDWQRLDQLVRFGFWILEKAAHELVAG